MLPDSFLKILLTSVLREYKPPEPKGKRAAFILHHRLEVEEMFTFTGCLVARADLKLTMPQPLEFWDYVCTPPHPAVYQSHIAQKKSQSPGSLGLLMYRAPMHEGDCIHDTVQI